MPLTEESAYRPEPPERGVRPSPLRDFWHNQSRRFGITIAVAVAIPVAVLIYFQFRALSNLQQTSYLILQQASREAADELTESITDALRAPYQDLTHISQERTEPIDLPYIRQSFDSTLQRHPFIDRMYVWSDSDLKGTHSGELLAYDRATRTFQPNPPEAAAIRAAVLDRPSRLPSVMVFTLDLNGRRAYMEMFRRYTLPKRGRVTSFTGFAVDSERLRHRYLPDLLSAELRRWQVPSGFPPLVVTLLDGDGKEVFTSSRSSPSAFVDERAFPLLFFEPFLVNFGPTRTAGPLGHVVPETWHLRVGYGDTTIEAAIASKFRFQRAVTGLLALIVALAIAMTARAAAREVRLAELKSDFVSSVSHDLKTPLSLIQLFAETLELGRLKDKDRAPEYIRIIHSEARKLGRLVTNLLDFSRIEEGLREYRLQPTDLAVLAKGVVDSLNQQFIQNRLTVTFDAQDTPTVLVDPVAIQQAIENLLSNAIKYSTTERRDVAVSVDEVNGYARLHVTDHGIGIAPRLQRKIFRKFYRIETGNGTGPQGTGLGLAIVEHIMRGNRGFVEVRSAPGLGSTFSLYFPVFTGEHQLEENHSGGRGRAPDVARTA